MRETALPLAQGVLPCLECLGEPVATGGTRQSLGHTCRVGQQLSHRSCQTRVTVLGWTLTGLPALVMLGGERLDSTAAHRVALVVVRRPREAG